jgi:hypothetical protein
LGPPVGWPAATLGSAPAVKEPASMGRAGCSSQRGGGIWYGERQDHGWRAAARVLPRRSGEAGGF